jgi:hypothetical protein
MDVTHLSAVHGEDRLDLPLQDGLAAIAREAYAMGWAASGGHMTDGIRAGSVAAVELALAHWDQPGILEATLHLGHLEGIWASIFDRRLQLPAKRSSRPLRGSCTSSSTGPMTL